MKARTLYRAVEILKPHPKLIEYSTTAKMFVIMFKHEFFPVGPFESWQAADEYAMRVIEPTMGDGNEWKIRPLHPSKANTVSSHVD
jgi:hypothetical protein